MSDYPQPGTSSDTGRIRARGFVGASRGGRNGGGGYQHGDQRGQVGSFHHRQQYFQGRAPYQQARGGPAEAASPVGEVSILVTAQRGSGSVRGRGGMRGNRAIPEVVVTRMPGELASKQGTSGKPVVLQTNYFHVKRLEDLRLFQYQVDFNPPVETRKVSGAIIANLKPQIGGNLFRGAQLYSRNKLCDKEIEYNTVYKATNEHYTVKLRRVGEVDGTNEVAFQVYNLINRMAMEGLKLQLIGRNLYDPAAMIRLQEHKLDLYPGYLTSIRQHEQDVLMCVELTHRVMRTETCLDLLLACVNFRGNFQDNFRRQVIGTIVMTTYGSNKTYTINDVDFSMTPESTFETKTGPISFLQYYRDRYNVTISDRRQPMLISRAKARDIRAGMPELIILVPELSRITGLSDENRRDFRLMRDLAGHTRLSPDRRIVRLEQINDRLKKCKDSADIFRFWKTELDRRLVEVQGRVLPTEMILLHPVETKARTSAGDKADWQAAFREKPMYLTVALKHWAIVVPARESRNIGNFLNCLYQVSRKMTFMINQPHFVEIGNDSPNVYVETLEQLCNKDPQLIMCVVTDDKADRYAAIKKKCCVNRAILTQVIKSRTITPRHGNMMLSVATKVAIQLNSKLGGIPWVVKVLMESVMCVGFDVCRDTKDKNKCYGALVAAMNHGKHRQHSEFYSTVNQHSYGADLSDSLGLNIVKALRSFQGAFENNLPERIIIYRDGVGDGELKYVHEHEEQSQTGNRRRRCDHASRTVRPLLKFPKTQLNQLKFLRNDFYLVSQSARQGTVSPTSYNVLYNGSELGADQLQVHSYKQTHMYYNWTGTVQVPAVCQYANKLAALVGQFLHQPPHTRLERKLHFL
ncbi:hypothetical protein quinque_007848 [Culex quinquefasciatus]